MLVACNIHFLKSIIYIEVQKYIFGTDGLKHARHFCAGPVEITRAGLLGLAILRFSIKVKGLLPGQNENRNKPLLGQTN